MIKFLCSNGHQLSAPENLAGKAGKCPKCNAPFVVPKLDETSDAQAEVALAGAAVASGVGASAAATAPLTPEMGSGKATSAAAGEIFVFLCPNGHKLNGPPSMKGRPGQCPHCGARFRIPTDDDLQRPEEEVPTGQVEDEEIPAGEPVEEERIDFDRLLGGAAEPVMEAAVEDQIGRPPPGAAGLGYILGKLWERRTQDTELEIFLSEGEIVAPDFYSDVLSGSDYGVFAVQEGDGSFVLTVIPWSAVRRIGMRRVAELPREIFS
jgi:hypothetical protein